MVLMPVVLIDIVPFRYELVGNCELEPSNLKNQLIIYNSYHKLSNRPAAIYERRIPDIVKN